MFGSKPIIHRQNCNTVDSQLRTKTRTAIYAPYCPSAPVNIQQQRYCIVIIALTPEQSHVVPYRSASHSCGQLRRDVTRHSYRIKRIAFSNHRPTNSFGLTSLHVLGKCRQKCVSLMTIDAT